jgi:hypothetical protein
VRAIAGRPTAAQRAWQRPVEVSGAPLNDATAEAARDDEIAQRVKAVIESGNESA